MFDRCRVWRQELSRQTDGSLPLAQWGALENHLANCPSCRAAAEADHALHEILSCHTGLLSPQQADAFDTRVLKALTPPAQNGLRASLARLLRTAQARWNAMPLTFFSQIASGALVAASVTVVCVFSALRPAAPIERSGVDSENTAALHAAYNEPPVPLETLLEHPSPRAALLWTTPSSTRLRSPEPTSAVFPASPSQSNKPAMPRRPDRRSILPPNQG